MSKKKRRDIPQFKTPIIETHCHLDYLDQADLEITLAKSRQVGIERIITIAVSAGNLENVMKLATSSDNICRTQRIHPHAAHAYTPTLHAYLLHHAGLPKHHPLG